MHVMQASDEEVEFALLALQMERGERSAVHTACKHKQQRWSSTDGAHYVQHQPSLDQHAGHT